MSCAARRGRLTDDPRRRRPRHHRRADRGVRALAYLWSRAHHSALAAGGCGQGLRCSRHSWELEEGTMLTPWRPVGYYQGDGSKYQWQNCVLATTTDLVNKVTGGRLRPPASALREITGDTSGGVSYGQAEDAALEATGGQVILEPRYGLDRSQARDLVAAGRSAGWSIDCSVTRYTTRRTGSYT